MNKKLILLAIALFTATRSFCAEPPRLIVQIVVGSMRAEDLGRYAANFGEGGFRRLMQGGTVYTDSRYDFQQTTTPVSLATLSTGALPSTHGIIGDQWVDYTSNGIVSLTDGRKGPEPITSLLRHFRRPSGVSGPRAVRQPSPPKPLRPPCWPAAEARSSGSIR